MALAASREHLHGVFSSSMSKGRKKPSKRNYGHLSTTSDNETSIKSVGTIKTMVTMPCAPSKYHLPADQNFAVNTLANYLGVRRQHVLDWIDSGEIKCAFDLRGAGSSRSLIRIPRAAVLEFLAARKPQGRLKTAAV
jgi:excisionase family DNA binding protein